LVNLRSGAIVPGLAERPKREIVGVELDEIGGALLIIVKTFAAG
jgi:hypothetical protein